MLIECKLKRQGGSVVDMGDGTAYHFKDDGTGRHVSNITVSKHIAILMGIPEGYAIPDEQLASMITPEAPGAQTKPDSAQVAATIVIQPTEANPVSQPDEGQTTVPVTTAPGGTDQRDSVDAVAELTEDTPIETIREVYLAEIGRVANANYKAQTLIAAIEAARKAKTA